MSGTVIKPLKKPWKVGGKEVTDIEVRFSTMEDVCSAEEVASPFKPNSFSVQMACLQLVRAGDFTGPFVASHFKGMKPAHFAVFTEAMREADLLGED